jgi:hypothetical protein
MPPPNRSDLGGDWTGIGDAAVLSLQRKFWVDSHGAAFQTQSGIAVPYPGRRENPRDVLATFRYVARPFAHRSC